MKESRKTLYTKMVLKESLLELLKSKEISRITVKELCDIADINRSTFYRHYKDVYDMVEQMEENIVNLVMKNIDINGITSEKQLEVFEAIFNELKNNKEELELLHLNHQSMRCLDHLFDRIYEYSEKILKDNYKELDDSKIQYIYSFISRGCTHMVSSWFKSGMKEDTTEMANLMIRALKGEFYY